MSLVVDDPRAKHWRVHVSPDTFARLVEQFTEDANTLDFPIEREGLSGFLYLFAPKFPSPITEPVTVEMRGAYSLSFPNSLHGLDRSEAVITFAILPLAQEECIVTLGCREPVLVDYFETMAGYLRNVLGQRCREIPDPRVPVESAGTGRDEEAPGHTDGYEAGAQRTECAGDRAAEPRKPAGEASGEIVLQYRRPGRPPYALYDQAHEKLRAGEPYEQVFRWFCKESNIPTPDKATRDAFKKAMRRRDGQK